jgi:hypothetical protein
MGGGREVHPTDSTPKGKGGCYAPYLLKFTTLPQLPPGRKNLTLLLRYFYLARLNLTPAGGDDARVGACGRRSSPGLRIQ